MVKWFSFNVNFKFKSLNQTFERSQTRNLVPYVRTNQSLLNLGVKWRWARTSGTLIPTCIIVLRDVPNNVFNLGRNTLVALITGLALNTNHAIERQKYVLLQKLLIRLLQQILVLVLSVNGVVSVIKITEEVVSVLLVVFLPAIVNSQLEKNSSLLAYIALVCLVQLRICKTQNNLLPDCQLRFGE